MESEVSGLRSSKKGPIILSLFAAILFATAVWAGAVHYGDVNISSDPAKALLLYPNMVKDWFDNGPAMSGVNLTTPAFVGDHGSDVQGEIGWTTSEEEMMAFLESLPTTRMKMKIVSEIPTRDESGNIEGRFKLPLLVFSKPSLFNPKDLHDLGKPIVWLQGQIHGNETSAGEAMLVIARKLATGQMDDVLDKVSVVMLPRYCVDGAYKYQRGTDAIRPVRTNLDQNRDNTSFESPITRIVHRLVNDYRPDVTADLHEMGYGVTTERDLSKQNLGYRDYQLEEIQTLVAPLKNVPQPVRLMATNLFEANVSRDLVDHHMNSHWYTMSTSRWVSADVWDGTQVISGEVQEIQTLQEGNPDEGITDPSFSLKPAVSILFESRSPKVRVNYMSRTYAHSLAVESILNTAAANADELKQTLENARQEMIDLGKTVDPADQVVLWSTHETVPDQFRRTLVFNADRSAMEIRSIPFTALRVKNLTTLKSVTRPRAYIIPADIENAGLVASRLSYTGARLERLKQASPIKVEAYTITSVGKPGDQSPRGSGFSGLSVVATAVSSETKTVSFPKDSYVVYMDQTAGTHAALALEPLGNRSYANYWMTHVKDGTGGEIGFLPASVDQEFGAYRYMQEPRLDTYPVIIDAPFVDGTMIEDIIPLTGDEMDGYEEEIGKPIVYVSKFRVLEGTADFTATLPYDYDGRSMVGKRWFLYNWESEEFDLLPEVLAEKTTSDIAVDDDHISGDGEVLLVAAEPRGNGAGGGGCNTAGMAGMLSLALLPGLALVLRRNR